MENKKIVKIILILVFLLVIIDQVSKLVINRFVGDNVVLLQNVFAISKTQNIEQNFSNIVLSVLILIVVIRFAVIQKHNLQKSTTIFLAMIIAGEFSNLLDIIFRGGTYGFMQIGNFPAINFADCFIIIGWILFIIDLLKKIRNVRMV